MKRISSLLLILVCNLFIFNAAVAQCPISSSSSMVVSNDTSLMCGVSCVGIKVISATTTLASTNTYAVTSIPYAPEPFNGGTLLPTLTDDEFSGLHTIPFPFCFFGNKYTTCVVGSNGNVSFDATLAGAYDDWELSGPLPGGPVSSNTAENCIMFPYMDFLNTSGGGIYVATYGTAPCRSWVVSYNNVAFYSCTGKHATCEMIIYESTNIIDIFIDTKQDCPAWNDGLAVTGIENPAGSLWYTAPGENGTAFTVTTPEGWRFTPNGTPTWSYKWYTSMTSPTPFATTMATTVCPTGTVTYYVKAVATSNCDSVVLWDSVKVTANVGTPILGSLTVCPGSTITLSDVTGGGVWNSGNPAVATVSGTGVVTGVTSGTATISYTTTSCTSTVIVTVETAPAITGIGALCVGATSPLADGVPGGTWTSNSPGIAGIGLSSGLLTGVSAGTAVISYFPPGGGCRAFTIATVHPIPAVPVPSAPFSYCKNAVAVPVSASGLNDLWYGPGVTSGMTVPPTPSTAVPGTVTFYVTQTSAFGCVSDSATDVITIIPPPAAPTVHDTAYCQYYNGFILPLNYEVDSASGSILNWYNAAGSPLSGSPTPVTSASTYPAGTTWNVSQTVNGCEGPQAAITVTVVPTPTFALSNRNWVCQYDSIPLSFNLTSGSLLVSPVYLWQLPFGAMATDGTTVTSPSVEVVFDSANVTYNIGYLTIGNLNGECSTTDTFTVRVIPAPYAQSYSKADVCLGDTVSLAISSEAADAANFFWKIDGVSLTSSTALNIVSANSNSGGPYSISWMTSGLHIITVQTNTAEGCLSLPSNDTVNVHALPDANFNILPSKSGMLCLEDSILFKAQLQDANVSYLWQPEHNFNNNNHGEVWGKVEQGRTDIILTVTDPFGCKASTDQQLSPNACCTVLFPSAFTPNGDGLNDIFRPVFNGFHNFHQFRVMNRWGQVVFESANSDPSWNGSFNGVPQDMGVYYYYIKYDCGGNTIEERGDCTLVR